MKPINWKEAAELIGIFAILASLIFVALQLRQEEELLQTEMRAAMVANTVSINESIIENADVWVRGNNGEELDPAESVIHARLITNVNDYMFQVRQTFLVTEPQSEEHILAEFAEMMRTSRADGVGSGAEEGEPAALTSFVAPVVPVGAGIGLGPGVRRYH